MRSAGAEWGPTALWGIFYMSVIFIYLIYFENIFSHLSLTITSFVSFFLYGNCASFCCSNKSWNFIYLGRLNTRILCYPRMLKPGSDSCHFAHVAFGFGYLVTKSFQTLCNPVNCRPTRLLCPWDFPGRNAGVGCHFLLQRSSQSRDGTHVFCLGRQILYCWTTRETHTCILSLCDRHCLLFGIYFLHLKS